MQRFKSPGQAQRFLAAYGPIAQHFRPRRHRVSAPVYRQGLGEKIPDLAGDHGPGPGRLKGERSETSPPFTWGWHQRE